MSTSPPSAMESRSPCALIMLHGMTDTPVFRVQNSLKVLPFVPRPGAQATWAKCNTDQLKYSVFNWQYFITHNNVMGICLRT